MCGEKGVAIVANYEKTCTRCKQVRIADDKNGAVSEFHPMGTGPTPSSARSICKICSNKARNKHYHNNKKSTATVQPRYMETDINTNRHIRKRHTHTDKITVNWCPRDEWPNFRYFSAGQFSTMLEDGVCTPGMYVTQHDTQYVVWGPKGEEQWMQRL